MPPQSSLYPTLMLSVELRGTDVEPMASDTVFTSFLFAGEVEAVKTTASSGLVSIFWENNASYPETLVIRKAEMPLPAIKQTYFMLVH